jgi:hypothetical protein
MTKAQIAEDTGRLRDDIGEDFQWTNPQNEQFTIKGIFSPIAFTKPYSEGGFQADFDLVCVCVFDDFTEGHPQVGDAIRYNARSYRVTSSRLDPQQAAIEFTLETVEK